MMKNGLIALMTVALGSVASAAETVIADFDNQLSASFAPVAGTLDWYFRKVDTETSGQNRNVGSWKDATLLNSVTSGNKNYVADLAASFGTGPVPPGTTSQVCQLGFSFTDGTIVGAQQSTNPLDSWLRAFSVGGTVALIAPCVRADEQLSMDIWTLEPLRITANLREGAGLAGRSVGQAGVASGTVECIGGRLGTIDAVQTTNNSRGGIHLMAGVWQTVTFRLDDPALITIRTLSGNGILAADATSDGLVGLDGFGFAPVKAQYGVGVKHQVFIDNIRSGAPTGTITGTVSLQNYDDTKDDLIPFELHFKDSNGDVLYGGRVYTDLSGNFSMPNAIPDGTYTAYAKCTTGLRAMVENVVVSGNSATIDFGVLLNGDCDNSNYINTDDYLVLSGSFDLGEGDTGFVQEADLDGNAYVNTDDYLLLSANFDLGGADF